MKVFMLAGQSNMQGFGKIAGYPVLRDERIFNLATGHAELAVEPLHHWHEHPYMPEGIGLGLAMPFALELLKALALDFLLRGQVRLRVESSELFLQAFVFEVVVPKLGIPIHEGPDQLLVTLLH